MAIKPFDPSKYHSTIHGEARFAFLQNGVYYNAQREPVDHNGDPIAIDAPADEAPAAETQAAAGQAPITPDDQDFIADEVDVDLKGWAADEAVYPWRTVVAAIRAKFDVTVQSKAEAKKLLAEKFPAEQ